MPQEVLVTGAYGQCGTAIIDHLHDRDDYRFTYLDKSDSPDDDPHGGHDTIVANVTNYDAVRNACEGQDAIVHLAADGGDPGTWESVLKNNIIGAYNVFQSACEAGVGSIVFASTNHVVGMYESELSPELYEKTAGYLFDHTVPIRPDSLYGTSKAFGEALGRFYIEQKPAPSQFYALRIGNVSFESEQTAENPRMKAMIHTRRDFAHQVDCCLQDDNVDYGIYYGISNNDRRWFSLENARAEIGYRPKDNGEIWEDQ